MPRFWLTLSALLLLSGNLFAQAGSPEDLFRKGNEYFASGRYGEATATYQDALALKPDFKEAWYNLGAAFGQMRLFDKEKEAYHKALAVDPGYSRAHYNLALALEDEGSYEEAANEYREVLKVQPDALDAYMNLGILLARQDRLDEAVKVYEDALKAITDLPELRFNLGVALGRLAEKATDPAQKVALTTREVESYTRAIELRASFYKAAYNMGLAWHRVGELDKEIAAYAKALDFKSRYPEALYNLAYAYEEKGELSKAADTWTRYLDAAAKLDGEKDYAELAAKERDRIQKKLATQPASAPAAPAAQPQ
jgi:tetratricopeptide (TPR) repeat protein